MSAVWPSNAAGTVAARSVPDPQIAVLDAGGQYCHLIARKVRELGVYAEVLPSETPTERLRGKKGVIISGGPSSVYEPGSPTVDPALFSEPVPVLGICYGLQLMAHLLGGTVERGQKGEYGLAFLELRDPTDPLFRDLPVRQQIWMSHRDTVTKPPAGFRVVASTPACEVAAMSAPERKWFGVQFHPEVAHTIYGREILSHFVLEVCGCHRDWDPRRRLPFLEESIRRTVGARNVFFFTSGGVDSSVAFALCLKTLGPDRVRGIFVDTGLMREGETDFVRALGPVLQTGVLEIVDARQRFLSALAGVRDPEQKRRIIGEEFVRIQQEIIESHGFLDEEWILGQGTIYPDTIESGGTEKASVIKTHHNRVPGIQRLIEAGRVVEPLASFYKDEVRQLGRELGLPEALVERHPFPGPGLAIRCLCAASEAALERCDEGWLLPLRSVGVQGDSRTYARVLVLDQYPAPEANLQAAATELINRLHGVNRIVAVAAKSAPLEAMRVFASALSEERVELLRRADAIVRALTAASGFDRQVWQFPVILIPVGVPGRPESVVLRPVHSVDGMTAQSVNMPTELLDEIARELLALDPVCAIFYDLTHKPPATIEWE
ncbi:MAG: glutamine-hydrolyzing GMP synthase [Bryobacterales bacterium]|nr:glutamine-hydrolyzing GMP synthase [Bryobacteraceae bacterium]MDW8355501.1 glutamine-hydrolyzing GMP synthase [Bryobacterales bacterium]